MMVGSPEPNAPREVVSGALTGSTRTGRSHVTRLLAGLVPTRTAPMRS